jgi:hypothetical protein
MSADGCLILLAGQVFNASTGTAACTLHGDWIAGWSSDRQILDVHTSSDTTQPTSVQVEDSVCDVDRTVVEVSSGILLHPHLTPPRQP